MLSNAGTCIVIVISISRLVLIAIVLSITRNSVIEREDGIPHKFVPKNLTVALTLTSSTVTLTLHKHSLFFIDEGIFSGS